MNSAGGNGVGVGTADIGFKVDVATTGVRVGSTTNDGLSVGQAGGVGVWVNSASNNGFLVATTGADGFGVASAARDGLWVGETSDDGIQLGNGTVTPRFGLFTPSPGTTNTTLLVNTANGSMKRLRIFLAPLLVFAFAAVALAQSGGGYDLTWNTSDSGGGVSSGSGYALQGTVGQPGCRQPDRQRLHPARRLLGQ